MWQCSSEAGLLANLDHWPMIDPIFAIQGELQAAIRSRRVPSSTEREGRIAIVHIVGPTSRSGEFNGELIGTSTDATTREINAVAADPGVAVIAVKVSSGGGQVAGTLPLANAIAEAAKLKPVFAYIEDMGASAAYWPASQATRVFSDPMAMIGGIGTYSVIYDYSGEAAIGGIKAHVIRAGKFKGAGTPGTEITAEHLAEAQRTVDALNEHFIAGVASGRKLSVDRVRELADGRVHVGDEARKLGLIDGTLSFTNFMNQLTRFKFTIGFAIAAANIGRSSRASSMRRIY